MALTNSIVKGIAGINSNHFGGIVSLGDHCLFLSCHTTDDEGAESNTSVELINMALVGGHGNVASAGGSHVEPALGAGH